MFENPRRGRQARNFTTNVPKILDLKSSSEQIFSENWRWVPLNIPVWKNRNGLFHLISNQNFRNFGLNGKCPWPVFFSLWTGSLFRACSQAMFSLSGKGTNTAGPLIKRVNSLKIANFSIKLIHNISKANIDDLIENQMFVYRGPTFVCVNSIPKVSWCVNEVINVSLYQLVSMVIFDNQGVRHARTFASCGETVKKVSSKSIQER